MPRLFSVVVLMLALLAAAYVIPALATPPGDNGRIVFRRYLGPDRTKGTLFTIAPDGSGERQLAKLPAGASDDHPDWSPDGAKIVFDRCQESCRVFVVSSAGGTPTPVTGSSPKGACPAKCLDDSYPAFSPDGKRVAFAHAFGAVRDDQIDHAGIYASNLDGSQLRKVTLPKLRAAEDGQPQWSPDGRRIVFVRVNVTAVPRDRRAIFVVNVNGTGLRRLTPWRLDAGDGPDWAPDGSRILFRSPDSDQFVGSKIYEINPDGSALRQLSRFPASTALYSSSYSPDGTSIVLGKSGVAGQADVYVLRRDGTGAAAVTRTPSWDSSPDWGPVGAGG
jgi:TolB protein